MSKISVHKNEQYAELTAQLAALRESVSAPRESSSSGALASLDARVAQLVTTLSEALNAVRDSDRSDNRTVHNLTAQLQRATEARAEEVRWRISLEERLRVSEDERRGLVTQRDSLQEEVALLRRNVAQAEQDLTVMRERRASLRGGP